MFVVEFAFETGGAARYPAPYIGGKQGRIEGAIKAVTMAFFSGILGGQSAYD